LQTTQGLCFLSVHKGHPRQQLLSYRAHVLKSTSAGTLISQAHSTLYSNPIDKHQDTQVSFLNTVSEHFKTMVSFGHPIDTKTKIATVQYLTMTQPNLHQTLEDLEKLNLKSGITSNITWSEYLEGIYANATTHDIRHTNATKPAKFFTRQVYSREIFQDASIDYAVDDDDDDYEQIWSPIVEDGVNVMKARFQKRDGNRNQRPP